MGLGRGAGIVVLVLAAAVAYGTLELVVGSLYWNHFSAHDRAAPAACHPDNEGSWAIGMYKGRSPFHLQPLESLNPRLDSSTAWPVANPVFTCSHVTGVRSNFVADPFLWPTEGGQRIYMFFESKTHHTNQGDIGLAESLDGGATFKHVGIVLDEPWHLSYPFVFKHGGQMYMMPEGYKGKGLRLYKAVDFPTKWELDRVIIDKPLVDASLVAWGPRLWIFATDASRKSAAGCKELEAWYSDTPQGPWTPHSQNPLKEGQAGARCGGRPVVHDGKLYRFGQDCGFNYGHKLRAFHVKTLTASAFDEVEVPLGFQESAKGRGAWNGLRYHHLDAHQLASGEWIAAMDGDSKLSGHITKRIIRRSLLFAPLTLLLTAAAVWMLSRWLDWGTFTDAWLQAPGSAGSAAAAAAAGGGGGASALVSAASGSEPNGGREPNGAGVVSKGGNLGGLRRSGGSTGSSMDFSDPGVGSSGGGGGGGTGPLHWDLTAAPRQRQTVSSNAGAAAKSWVVAGGGSSSSNVGGVGGADLEDDAERGNSGRGLGFAVSGDGSKQKRVQNASTADLHSLASTAGWAPLTSLANAVTRASNALKTAVQAPLSSSPAAADLEKPKPGSGLPPLSGLSATPKDATKDGAANGGSGGSSSSGASSGGAVLSHLGWFASPFTRGGPVVRLCIYTACLLAAIAAVKGLVWYAYVYRKPEILSAVTTYFARGSYDAIAVDGQASVFTLLVMTYDVRKVTLQAFVRHYSRCPSVGDIVVVWNKGAPPDPETDFDSAVPVRVRVEERNSLNNRFKADPLITNRAMLSLDDDLFMTCNDIEHGFSKWRQHPERMTGYYMRLLEGEPPQQHCTYCEKHTAEVGRYNILLTGAAFFDKDLMFKAYWDNDNAAARDYVDKNLNCEDFLANFVLAKALRGRQYVEYVRPTQRLDVGKLTSKQISAAGHGFANARQACLLYFDQVHGHGLLNEAGYPIDWNGRGPPWCGPQSLGCVYL
ncbi:MAG: hypothetical protein WDW36_010212 [Sanguina aurantia]